MKEPFPSASVLDQLRRKDYRHLSSSLREPLQHLTAQGFRIKDVHFHNAYEIVLDGPIPKSLEPELPLPDGVQCFDDHDDNGQFVGIGLICSSTNQVISGH